MAYLPYGLISQLCWWSVKEFVLLWEKKQASLDSSVEVLPVPSWNSRALYVQLLLEHVEIAEEPLWGRTGAAVFL